MTCPGAFSGGRRKTGMKAANDAQMRGECRLIGERWAQDREENGGNRLSRANAPTFLKFLRRSFLRRTKGNYLRQKHRSVRAAMKRRVHNGQCDPALIRRQIKGDALI